MTTDYRPYIVGNVVLSDHQAALTAATSAPPAATPTPQSGLTPAQQGLLNLIGQPNSPAGAVVSKLNAGDFNPADLGAAYAGAEATGIAQGIGQAVLTGLTDIGHAIASGIVALLQWMGGLAKQHVVPLAVAAVVLYMVFMR